MLLTKDYERSAVADLRAKVTAGRQKCAVCKAQVRPDNFGAVVGTDAGAFFVCSALCSPCAARAERANPSEARRMFATLHESWRKYLDQVGRSN